jgi:hypothetical protein
VKTPAIRLAFDHGFREVGPGTITLGGALGFFNKYYKSTYWDNNGISTIINGASIILVQFLEPDTIII